MTSQQFLSKKRLHWVDKTKGLAILGIVLFHFFQNYPQRLDIVSLLDRNGARIGFAAVDIFFVIAGFNTSYIFAKLLKLGKISFLTIDWKSWLKKRFLRLYPTYWLAIALSLLLFFFFGKIRLNSGVDFLAIILGLPGYERFKLLNPGFWFFAVILQAYLVIPLIFSFCRQNTKAILGIGIFFGLLTKVACWLIPQQSELFWFLLQNDFLGSYFFQLCLGLYWGFIYFEHQHFRKIDLWFSSLVFAFGIVLYAALIIQGVDILFMSGFDMLFTPLFFLILHWITEHLTSKIIAIKNINLLSLLGVYSYQIYLIHQPLFFVLLTPLVRQIDINPYVKLALCLVITTVVLSTYVILFTKLDTRLSNIIKKMPWRLA